MRQQCVVAKCAGAVRSPARGGAADTNPARVAGPRAEVDELSRDWRRVRAHRVRWSDQRVLPPTEGCSADGQPASALVVDIKERESLAARNGRGHAVIRECAVTELCTHVAAPAIEHAARVERTRRTFAVAVVRGLNLRE